VGIYPNRYLLSLRMVGYRKSNIHHPAAKI
jgi:hypothetical protein